jgi:hypothetical protein
MTKEMARSSIIQEKWGEAKAQLMLYIKDKRYEQYRNRSQLKMWIVIFCANICIVNQEVDEESTMKIKESNWWF